MKWFFNFHVLNILYSISPSWLSISCPTHSSILRWSWSLIVCSKNFLKPKNPKLVLVFIFCIYPYGTSCIKNIKSIFCLPIYYLYSEWPLATLILPLPLLWRKTYHQTFLKCLCYHFWGAQEVWKESKFNNMRSRCS